MPNQPSVTVFQVRAIDKFKRTRIVHAYLTPEEANEAIATMRENSNDRYIVVAVDNDSSAFWGLDF